MPPARSSPDEPIRTVATTASTNDDVALLARDGAPEGLWLRAEQQSGGRGRQGREWISPPGNLYASTLVRLTAGDPPAATLSLVAGLALHQVAQAYVPDAPLMLKWPNDLLADGAKLAGILLERHEDAVIAGFGVNLAEYPTDLERPATSLRALTGSAPEAALFVEQLAASFADWLARWRGSGVPAIRTVWLAKAHPIGTALSASGVDGLFDGLDEQGALRLRRADGSVDVIQAGDVFLI